MFVAWHEFQGNYDSLFLQIADKLRSVLSSLSELGMDISPPALKCQTPVDEANERVRLEL